MKFSAIRPMLRTNELEATINFYVEKLGFVCYEFNTKWGWASLHRDEAELMLAKPNEHIPFEKPVFTGSFYFNVNDVNTLWEKLKDISTICYPIENFEYGMREFALYDNNRYLLQFGQDISTL